MKKTKTAIVLFSGGKDSSATTVQLAVDGYKVRLFTCSAGPIELSGPHGDSAADIRVKEILKAFPKSIDKQRVRYDDSYLIRKLGIERTNKEHVVYPLVLALTTHTAAICYCLKNEINTIASGYSGYQGVKENYIEQHQDYIELTKKFLEGYGISYLTPVVEKSEPEIKDLLEKYGISSNSLEEKTIFSGIDFDKTKALKFWTASLPFCEKFIKEMTGINFSQQK